MQPTQGDDWTGLAAISSDVFGTFLVSTVLPNALALALALLCNQ